MFAGSFAGRFFGYFSVSFTFAFAGAAFGQMSSGSDGGSMAPSYGYGYGGYGYHASTAAEGFLRGQAAVIDSLGNFEVNDAQAGILREQGRALNRENDLKQTEALLQQKKMWDDARVQARKDREIRLNEGRELLANRRSTSYTDAYHLSTGELDYKTGEITWPDALQDRRF